MPKLFRCPTQQNKKRTSVRLPKNMYLDIISVLLKTGKSTRDFSAWISEAIINLEKDNNHNEIIAEELLDRGENISKPVSLSIVANEKLRIMKDKIIQKVIENHINNGDITLTRDNKKIDDKTEIKKELELFMNQTLERLLKNCLFVS